MLDFNSRRYCLQMGGALDAAAPEASTRMPMSANEGGLRRLVHLKELMAATSLTAKQIWKLVKMGKIERPIRLHYRAFAWPFEYISDWLLRRGYAL